MRIRQLEMIYAVVIRKIIHGSARAKLRLFLLLFGLVMRSLVSSAQVGSGSPQASALVQVETKADDGKFSNYPPLFVPRRQANGVAHRGETD
jgi:hypothetical protein